MSAPPPERERTRAGTVKLPMHPKDAATAPLDPCSHSNMNGVDQYFGPGKIMVCDFCGERVAVDWGGDA